MIYGVDTDFLVALEILDHPFHQQADGFLRKLLDEGHDLALTPQTLAEFIHIVTNAKRMPHPLTMALALSKAEHWWQAAEVQRVFPDGECVSDFLKWLSRYQLGRKRLLDTLLAATYQRAGIRHLITNNDADYRVLDCFELVTYRSSP